MVPCIDKVVPPIIDILDEPILIPHDVDEFTHKVNIPVFIPVPFEINTVLPTVVIGFPCAATLVINNPPSYVGTSVLSNDIARLELLLVNLLLPNHV